MRSPRNAWRDNGLTYIRVHGVIGGGIERFDKDNKSIGLAEVDEAGMGFNIVVCEVLLSSVGPYVEQLQL